jgi:pilus assembly protein CpaC
MLAEPKLTAISGEEASFLAGGEFPIPVSQSNDAITVSFKPFGVGLTFTPVVLSEERISLKIATEVSEISTDGAVTVSDISIPGISVRRASTTLELPSGGSLVLAGLLSDGVQKNIDGIPGLKDLPVLGSLFRSSDFRRRETELVVMVTPLIVNPVDPGALSRPDEGLVAPSEDRLFLMGEVNRIYGDPTHPPKGSFRGDVGFIVE